MEKRASGAQQHLRVPSLSSRIWEIRITASITTWPTKQSSGSVVNTQFAPERPIFVYYAPGATHSPHHPKKEWIAKYKGQFDQGWDKVREETLARQKKLGLPPADTQLTPRIPGVPAWNSLNAEQKQLYAYMMEIYAGYLSQTDYNAGRVLDAIDKIGELDNTLVIYIVGDKRMWSSQWVMHGASW